MPKALRMRFVIIAVVAAVGMIYVTPTLFGEMPEWWGRLFPTQRIRLGLDLKGGIHLVLGVQVDKAVENATELGDENLPIFTANRDRVKEQLEKAEPG